MTIATEENFAKDRLAAKEDHPAKQPAAGRVVRMLLIITGILLVAIGVVGAFLPVLPTTPFLLLAAACFARSSRRLHQWLFANRLFGEYLHRYRENAGLPLAFKISTLAILWTSLTASSAFAVPPDMWWMHALLLAVGIGVTIHILRIKTRRDS